MTQRIEQFLATLGHLGATLLVVCLLLSTAAFAVDYHPDVKRMLRENIDIATGAKTDPGFSAARANGMCQPEGQPLRTPSMMRRMGLQPTDALGRTLAAGANAIDTIKVLVILVDFSDNPWNATVPPNQSNVSATPDMFDSVLFSTGNLDGSGITNPTGSMTEFYMENSYGTFFIQGVITQWYRMPRTYATYVGTDNGLQSSGINARDLALDAVNAADPDVDFAMFDQYGPNGFPDGQVDGVFVVHAGMGNEDSHLGGFNDIHSHKWSLRSAVNLDGVFVSSYTMEPEESFINTSISPIGVFCHEYGHFIGLPDLYDTDFTPESSDGLGVWSLMASGNWLNNSQTPAQFDCWSKAFVGFMQPFVVNSNLKNVPIPQAEDSAVCFKLSNSNLPTGEYFLVENRQKVGFDQFLPGSGLMIYHVDQAFNSIFDNNDNQNRYLVALEQADGKNDLALTLGNDGDGGDPFFAPGAPEFHDLTNPNSRDNGTKSTTEIAVWDISPNGPMMTANLDVSFSRPYLSLENTFVLDQSDGDGIIEPGESFTVDFLVLNRWADGQNAYVKLLSTSPDLNFGLDSLDLGTLLGFNTITASPNPFTFSVANSLVPRIDTLFFEFHSDNEENVTMLPLEIEIGAPEYLIVNADKNGSNGEYYIGDLHTARTPSRAHVKSTDGAVTLGLLNQFKNVIWFFGDTGSAPPTAGEIQVIKDYLNGGGNLMISGQQLAGQLDSAFLFDYLHATLRDSGTTFGYSAIQEGVSGSNLSDGFTRMQFFGNGGASNWAPVAAYSIIPANGGQPILHGFRKPADHYQAISYEGSYKLVFFSLPFEAMENQDVTLRTQRRELFERITNFFGNIQTDVGDENDFQPVVRPETFTLNQNYPNPFNPSTTISYTIHSNGESRSPAATQLEIYNVLGQRVSTLVSEPQGPGTYTVEWAGRDDNGAGVASGVYFYRLKRGKIVQSKKMVLLK